MNIPHNPRAVLSAVIALAWPTMLEQLMQTAVQYIDTAMVGSLGTQATAAAGSTTTVSWLILITVSAVGVGFLSFISQAWGSGEEEKARRAAAQAVLAVLVIGAVYTAAALALSRRVPVWMRVDPHARALAADYFFILYLPMLPRTATLVFGALLRAVGDSKTPMRVGILVNLLNVILNFLLIYNSRTVTVFSHTLPLWGAGMGVRGAAAASAIAFAAGGLFITAALFRHPLLSPRGHSIRPDRAILIPCARVAVPYMLQGFTTAMGYVVFAAMINSLGEISTAAHTVANTVESAFYIPGYGMQSAAAALTGQAIGAGDRLRLRGLGRALLFCEVTLMILSGGLLFAFAPNMVRLFSADATVLFLGTTVLRMVACSEPFFGVSLVIEGMLQGAGKTTMPFFFNLLGMWGVRILGTFLCLHFYHGTLIAAWSCMIAHNLLLFGMYVVYFSSGRWNPLVPKAI